MIGTFYRMAETLSFLRAAAVGGALILALLFHPALCSDSHLGPASPFAMALPSASGSPIIFGPAMGSRLVIFLKLSLLSMHRGVGTMVAVPISVALLGAFVWTVMPLVSMRRKLPPHYWTDAALATLVAFMASVIVMLIFPDTMAGGWGHFRRFVIIPFYWVLFLLAFGTFSPLVKGAMTSFATFAALTLLGTTIIRESTIHDQMAPLMDIESIVGSHCTVLPIVLETHPIDSAGQPMQFDYNLYFQAANRLEVANDRVVLFNYLARLAIYPIHFRPSIEPQGNIFHWGQQEQRHTFEDIDVEGFERHSGLHVDYVLVWGKVEKTSALRQKVEMLISQSQTVYLSQDKRVALYHRPADENSRCAQ